MIQVKHMSEKYANSCTACFVNKGIYEITMGIGDTNNDGDEKFHGGAVCICLCESCIMSIHYMQKSFKNKDITATSRGKDNA